MERLCRLTRTLAALACIAWPAFAAEPMTPPASVMIVGDFHMSNPGRDLHNLQVDDVLAPPRQAEIAAAIAALSRFHPTIVAAEWPADIAADRYAHYLRGDLPPSRNEVVQLGFRLAKRAGLTVVHGVDVAGDFPYEAVQAYAKNHGGQAILDRENAGIEAMVRAQAGKLAAGGVIAELRYLNDPSRISSDNGFYRAMLRIGGGSEQPGADLLTAWYRRNFLICANIVQLARPGDRVVVFYGSGHAFLLRQCIQESPGLRLVEPNDFLPR
ncbi:MAG: DUF5694 domain-containing protein [Pseudomonadota bacterium]|nr:DUF5694 domain-containing protein [Pseudomonadota bacterium]